MSGIDSIVHEDQASEMPSVEKLRADLAIPKGSNRPKLHALDADFHESSHNSRRAMSSRMLLGPRVNRQDDFHRSSSAHQLRSTPEATPTPLPTFHRSGTTPVVPNATESLGTEETAQESDDDGSAFSGDSFCDADGDCAADREYLRKDLGASLHDDELDFDSDGDDDDDDDDDGEDLGDQVKDRMKIDGGPDEAMEDAASGLDA